MGKLIHRTAIVWLSSLLAAAGLVMMGAPANASGPAQYVGVPSYWSPDTAGGSAIFDRLAQNSPTVGITVINGPTSSAPIPFDPATAAAIQKMHQSGEKVLGYVDTGYLGQTGHTTTRVNPGSTAVADWQAQMKQDADAWYSLYGSYGIDGIFFDQTLSSCGTSDVNLNDYKAVTDYVRTTHSGAYVAINPGTTSEECYTQIADTIMIFENDYSVYQSWSPPAYAANYPTSKFWIIAYNVPSTSALESAVAKSKSDHAGIVYFTDRTLDATHFPYDQLPNTDAYWNDELLTVFGGSDSAAPSAPSNVHATASGCSSTSCTVNLAWDRATDDAAVVGYDVYRDSTFLQTVYGPSAVVTGGMSASTGYTFTVKARDEAGNIGTAASATITTPAADTQPPTAPGGLSASSQSGSSATLTWQASTDNVGVVGYDIYQNSSLVSSVTGTSASVTMQGATGGSSYVYTVQARDAAGNSSSASNQLLLTVPPPTSGAIDDYSACMDSADAGYQAGFTQTFDYHRVFINTDNNASTGYALPYGNAGMDYLVENNGLYHYTGSGSDWNWTAVGGITPLVSSAGGTYTWTVPASALTGAAQVQTLVFQAAGTSPDAYSQPVTLSRTSGTGCVTPSGDSTPPSAPTNVHATSVTGTSTTLAWDAATDNIGVTGYDLYQDNNLVASVSGSTLTATINGQTPASSYDYIVKARDAAGNASSASNQAFITNPAPTSGAINNYSACMTSATAKYVATYNGSYSYQHVFINADDNTSTGYALPFGNPGGMDYMIENNALYHYTGSGSDWSWSQIVGVAPLTATSGTTYTWQIPVSDLGASATNPQLIVFHGQGNLPDAYSTQITVTQSSTCP